MNEIEELIHRRRRQILLHSYLYYQLDKNLISDHTYDEWCKELAELQLKHPKECASVKFYYKEFKDFDGSTGYHLPKEAWMHDTAIKLLRYHEEFIK